MSKPIYATHKLSTCQISFTQNMNYFWRVTMETHFCSNWFKLSTCQLVKIHLCKIETVNLSKFIYAKHKLSTCQMSFTQNIDYPWRVTMETHFCSNCFKLPTCQTINLLKSIYAKHKLSVKSDNENSLLLQLF